MKRTNFSVFILLAFILFFFNAKAQFEYDTLITHSDLPFTIPYTTESQLQSVGIDVNNDKLPEFIAQFLIYPSQLPGENKYITLFICINEDVLTKGVLTELETISLSEASLHAISDLPPLNDTAEPTFKLPYASLFPEGVRIEDKIPNIYSASAWEEAAILSGEFPFHVMANEQTPLESSYIDGGTNGYIGARYSNDNDETYYGWIEVSFDDSEPSITIESMSFQETPDRRSYTGSLSVVPIAFISSILAFFGIGIGVYFRRRK